MPLIPITYNEQYFRGREHSQTSEGGYDSYRWDSYLTENPGVLANKFYQRLGSLAGKKVLVIGCAYGFLVKALVALGADAYGMDISAFAVSQTPEDIAGRTFIGDARLDSSYQQAKTLAGLTKANDKFDAIVDEDTLCCFTDSEAITVCSLMRNYGNYAVHLVDESPNLATWYNFHTIAEWKLIIGEFLKEKWFARYAA